jgi:hypothetical protein
VWSGTLSGDGDLLERGYQLAVSGEVMVAPLDWLQDFANSIAWTVGWFARF